MSSEQPRQPGQPHERAPQQGWEPLPQGEYDADATAFVQLPEGLLDLTAMPPGADPLAAPGQGYVPPPIASAGPSADSTVSGDPGVPADPAATGQWTMPFGGAGAPHPPATGGQWPMPHEPQPPSDTGWAGQGAPDQWTVPPAADEIPDESGEYLLHGSSGPERAAPWQLPDAASGAPWNAERGDTAAGAGEQWTYPAEQQRPGTAAEPERPHGTGGPDGTSGDWSSAGREPGPWSVPAADPSAPDTSGAYRLDEAAPADPAPRGSAPGGGPDEGGSRYADDRWSEPESGPADASRGEAGADPREGSAPGASGQWSPPAAPEQPPADRNGFGPDDYSGGSYGDGLPAGDSAKWPDQESGARHQEAGARSPEGDAPRTETGATAVPHASSDGGERDTDTADRAAGLDRDAAPDTGDVPGAATGEAPAEADDHGPAADDAGEAHSEHPYASYVLSVNGADRPVTDAWIGESLLYVLRERLGLAGAKDGCSQGECGACSVQVDGRLVASCLVPAATAAGSEVRTVEGLAVDGAPSDVQRALAAQGAVQCGFCVPGLAMTVHDLLEGNHAPTELETRQAICGNLCRCSGYRGVLDAVRAVVAGRAEAAEATGPDTPAPDEPRPDAPAENARIPHQAGPYGGTADPSTGGLA
ncbi:2Fe-2S iron-sulfur cluster-binding protein [Streptomyces sp. 8N706]|uniref:2Fe-2S iron-sulfur cluster-binding protein n=1 Tax=Streptomyces sp. 8N706 TaxID=3457416 RepID=UPI003FD33A0B